MGGETKKQIEVDRDGEMVKRKHSVFILGGGGGVRKQR